jgi:hypothetical protein
MLSSCGRNGWVWVGALLRKSYKHGWSFRGDEATTSDIRTLLTRAHVSLSVTSTQRVHAKQNTIPPLSRHRRLRDGASLGQLDSPRPYPSRGEKYEYAYPSRNQRSYQCGCPYRFRDFPRTKQLVDSTIRLVKSQRPGSGNLGSASDFVCVPPTINCVRDEGLATSQLWCCLRAPYSPTPCIEVGPPSQPIVPVVIMAECFAISAIDS